jgi:DNA-binding transcriptional regulator YiaG
MAPLRLPCATVSIATASRTTVEELCDLAAVRALTRSGEARAIRERAGVSLREVGGAVGVSGACVLRWEQAERSPRGSAALRYGELLAALRGEGTVTSGAARPGSVPSA